MYVLSEWVCCALLCVDFALNLHLVPQPLEISGQKYHAPSKAHDRDHSPVAVL